jgi:spore coat polysaccharide biosynthesis protein SpsF
MKTLAIIQARTGSSRLPGKVLERAGGRTLLAHIVERAQRARGLDEVIVATTVQPADDAVADEAARLGVATYRGSELDVLDRYYKAAFAFGGDAIVRLTADCPLLDPTIVSLVLERYRSAPPVDYVSSGFGFPEGYGAEVFNGDVLATMWREATQPFEREHVTPFVLNHPNASESRWSTPTSTPRGVGSPWTRRPICGSSSILSTNWNPWTRRSGSRRSCGTCRRIQKSPRSMHVI